MGCNLIEQNLLKACVPASPSAKELPKLWQDMCLKGDDQRLLAKGSYFVLQGLTKLWMRFKSHSRLSSISKKIGFPVLELA